MELASCIPYALGLELAIGRAGSGWARSIVGWAKIGPGQNWPGFFRAKILVAKPALKTGLVGPNSLLKAKKNSGGPGRVGPYRAGPYWAGPNLARFFSGQ